MLSITNHAVNLNYKGFQRSLRLCVSHNLRLPYRSWPTWHVQLQNNHIAAIPFIVCTLAAAGIICADCHIRGGDSRIMWIWRHTKPPWTRRDAYGYASYGSRLHGRHTAVPRTGVEAWSYAAILQKGHLHWLTFSSSLCGSSNHELIDLLWEWFLRMFNWCTLSIRTSSDAYNTSQDAYAMKMILNEYYKSENRCNYGIQKIRAALAGCPDRILSGLSVLGQITHVMSRITFL